MTGRGESDGFGVMTENGMHRPNPRAESDAEAKVPLYVDLDGTLVKGDMLAEGALRLLKQSPGYGFAMLLWLLTGGKASLKKNIARLVEPDVEGLPIQQDFLLFLKDEASRARPIYMASAADARNADAMATRMGCFSGVLASDGLTNLAGSRKLDAILAHCDGGPFDYAGNARQDLAIWRRARHALLVNPEPGVARALRATGKVAQVFDDRKRGPAVYLHALRIHQWLKNLLLFVPLLTAQVWDLHAVGAALIAFVSFGLCASATYLCNDLLDLAADRTHPRKRDRPVAAGDISVPVVGALIAATLLCGLALATLLPARFGWMLLAYLAVTLGYSLRIKTYAVIDVICLGGLYTLRILAGAAAIGVAVSSWLLAFSMFVFFSLALVKRCSELVLLRNTRAQAKMSGRDYHVSDYSMLAAMGVASGYVAVLILALFVDSPAVAARYPQPELLWLLCPAVLYWVSRLWIKTSRGEVHDDPIVYSVKDPASWIVFAVVIGIWIAAQVPA